MGRFGSRSLNVLASTTTMLWLARGSFTSIGKQCSPSFFFCNIVGVNAFSSTTTRAFSSSSLPLPRLSSWSKMSQSPPSSFFRCHCQETNDDTQTDTDKNNNNRIFVGNLSPDTSSVEPLQEIFSQFGKVHDVSLHGLWKRSIDDDDDLDDDNKIITTGGDKNDQQRTTSKKKQKQKKNKVRPYAFVTYVDSQSAHRAIHEWNNSQPLSSSENNLFSEWVVQVSLPRKPRPKSIQRKRRAQERRDFVDYVSKHSNIVLQCPKSHLGRLTEYVVSSSFSSSSEHQCEVLGNLDPGTRSVALLFIKSQHMDPMAWTNQLLSVPYVDIAVNKLYMVKSENAVIVRGGDSGVQDVAKVAWKKLTSLQGSTPNTTTIVARVQAFPPKMQKELLASLDAIMEEEKGEDGAQPHSGIDIRPTGFTHTLSVVQLEVPPPPETPHRTSSSSSSAGINNQQPQDSQQQSEECHTYLLGLTPAMPTDAVSTSDGAKSHPSNGDKESSSISRAYYKIQEVLTRYKGDSPRKDGNSNNASMGTTRISSTLRNRLKGSIALDCGAAPGGWTKFLMEEMNCQKVYSIDPGELAPAVQNMVGVQHYKMTVEEAIPQLAAAVAGNTDDANTSAAAKRNTIDLWASDMCLHNISEQIDWLLKAKDARILSAGAMFILTLKCNIGHSASAYDNQVANEVTRLKGIATGIETLHLFSNRSGERTVIGFLVD